MSFCLKFSQNQFTKNGALYIKRLEISNFKAFSACFIQTSPLDVPTYYFGFGLNNLAPFWTISQRVDKFIDTLKGNFPIWEIAFNFTD